MKVGGVLHTVLNADLKQAEQKPEQKKHHSGEGFKELFDESCDKERKKNERI